MTTMTTPEPSRLNIPIDKIDVFRVSVPLAEPLVLFGSVVVQSRDFIIARAYAGGQCGTGFGLTRGAAVDQIAMQQIAPLVINKPVGSIRQIWTSIRQSVNFFGESGYYARAFSAVDIALWDLQAKVLNVPLWRMLGGTTNQVPCMAITGYYRPGDSLTIMRQEAELLVKAGYTKFKVPVGHDFDLDRKRMRLLRDIIGPEGLIGVDAHGSFNSIKEALDVWNNIAPFNIAFLEDPFAPANWQLAIEFARTTPVKIAYGENIAIPSVIQRLGGLDGIDIVRPDATYQLGITGYMQGIAPALENHVTIFPHYFPDVHAPLVGALGGAWVEESPPESDTVNFRALRAEQPNIQNGMWQLTEKPGLGIAWDEDALIRFRVP